MNFCSFHNFSVGLGGGISSILLSRTRLPKEMVSDYVISLTDACSYCQRESIDALVINQGEYERLPKVNDRESLSIVLWAHNDIPKSRMKAICSDKTVKKVVFCGKEFFEYYYDHPIIRKSTYIYNIFPIRHIDWYREKMADRNNHNVVYMGAISHGKGFHLLAKAWPEVIKRIPDAQLYVIGSGRLYDKSAELGQYGIASDDYEKLFMPYLLDEGGNIHSSVHFLGVLGNEKNDVLGRCKVGVPNPSGLTETFCITAIEMQLLGCSLTTIRHHAYLDTVFNKEYLYTRDTQLAEYIVKRFESSSDEYEEVYNFIAKRFSTERSLRRWQDMLCRLDNTSIEPYSGYAYHYKWLKAFLLRLKIACPFFNVLPSVEGAIAFGHRCKNKLNLILKIC